jgi:hypothetical protein
LKCDYDKQDEQGMNEIRLRAIQLVAKLYLFFLPTLEKSKQIENLWIQILDVVGRYLKFCKSRKQEVVVLVL